MSLADKYLDVLKAVVEGPEVYVIPHDQDGKTITKTRRVEALANQLTADINRVGSKRHITFFDGSQLRWDGAASIDVTEADPARAYDPHVSE